MALLLPPVFPKPGRRHRSEAKQFQWLGLVIQTSSNLRKSGIDGS
jgi:hypothetical protein